MSFFPRGLNVRRHPRAAARLRVVDKRASDAAPPSYTRDISGGGMFIQTPMPRPLGDRFVLSIDLPTCEVPLELPAEVVRCVATGADRGMAVRFLYSGIAQQAFIEGQVAQLLSRS